MKHILITKNGINDLLKKINIIKNNKIPEILKLIETSRSYGDLKENHEYKCAKEQYLIYEKKIKNLEYILSISKIFYPKDINNKNIIYFGSIVELINMDNNTINKYQIVSEFESDIKKNKISINSPLSKILIGKKKNDIINLEIFNKIIRYKIISIYYEN
ncbi:GreA/GreB family elongation factor [Candidatus Nardonella dryophthoridicola]|uniref:Transcription elongation factor GreA n=1 Tax=endosymbiont of Rhynchophorus ferrugineus TaxID=1972133 RepID=A0A2Z5T3M2_9GAMM|nr:GreA/GreB family elongation factor [Candidatus Nardonella dryophthoridicola]BBA84997.1 transcription elongation factor GreA [endosymbiont of Rhynchophorus ferrugineus]